MDLPELPDGYHWQLCKGDCDRTGDLDWRDADEVRIFHESSDLAIALKAVDGGWEVEEGFFCGSVVYTLEDAVKLAGLAV